MLWSFALVCVGGVLGVVHLISDEEEKPSRLWITFPNDIFGYHSVGFNASDNATVNAYENRLTLTDQHENKVHVSLFKEVNVLELLDLNSKKGA